MVNASTFTMVSTLAGLQRIEAKIQRALNEAGSVIPGPATDEGRDKNAKIMDDAERHMVRAQSVMGNLDMLA